MPEKFIGYFRLVERCAQPGCPVCRSVTEDSRHYLDALLYEQVTDPETRRGLRASWGFCNWHTWMLFEIQNAISGAAIIYEDVLGVAIGRVRRLLGRGGSGRFASWLPFGRGRRRPVLSDLYRRRRTCPACASAAEAEDRYLETMVSFADEPDLKAAYARSDGLCLPHALRALELASGSPQLRELLDRTVEKWSRVGQDLDSFVRKHDYRNTEPYSEDESRACGRAFETLAGAPGVFGNAAHAQARTAPAEPPSPRGRDGGHPPPPRADRGRDDVTARPLVLTVPEWLDTGRRRSLQETYGDGVRR